MPWPPSPTSSAVVDTLTPRVSSSASVSSTSAGPAIPTLFAAAPFTCTVLSAASTSLSTAATVTVPVLAVAPAAMVSTALLLSVKSEAWAGASGTTETVTLVSAPDGWSSVAVTVDTPPSSPIEALDSDSVTVGAASSSCPSSVSVTSAGPAIPRLFAAAPFTCTVLSAASTSLSTAVTVTVPVLAVAPAAMVSTALLLSVKSEAWAGASGTTETVTLVSAPDGWSSDAVTVDTPPSSPIKALDSDSVTVGAASSSSSVSVTSAGPAIPRLFAAAPFTCTVLSAASTSLSTAVTVTAPVLAVCRRRRCSAPRWC